MAELDGFLASLVSFRVSVFHAAYTWYQCKELCSTGYVARSCSELHNLKSTRKRPKYLPTNPVLEFVLWLLCAPPHSKCFHIAFSGRRIPQWHSYSASSKPSCIPCAEQLNDGRCSQAPRQLYRTSGAGLEKLIISQPLLTLDISLTSPASQATAYNCNGSKHIVKLWTTKRQTERLAKFSSTRNSGDFLPRVTLNPRFCR